MLSVRPAKQFAGAMMGIALCVSSTAAGAAATPASSLAPMSPLVALSAFATPLSASAVSSTLNQPSAASLQMSAAAAQGAPDGYEQPVLPVLLALAGFLALTALVLSGDEDGDIDLPLPPMSPD